ncbi:MAG TPA: TMEM175 family protein [Chloroflexota bacterium]
MSANRAAEVPTEGGGDTTRIMALSDGLFAIVLTLLVLDLKPAPTASGHAYDALVELWPRLFAFFLTFLVGGSFWVSHHSDLETLRGYDRTCMWLNLMFLLPVSLLPFTTALIGDNTGSVTWSLYAINVIAIGLTQTALWSYVRIVGFIEPTHTRAELQFQMVRHLTIPAVFALSVGVSFILPGVAPYTALLIPVVLRAYTRVAGWKEPSPPRPRAASLWRAVGFTPVAMFVIWSIWLGIHGQLSGGTAGP